MLAQIEARLLRLEAKHPKPLPDVRLLTSRAASSWIPRGIERLTPKQSAIFLSPARFRVVVAGRRSGKSSLAVAEMIRLARTGYNKLCWYIAPSYRMAKQTVWAALKSAVPPQWIRHTHETELSLTLRGYESTIALRSADNPDALRGVGLDFAVLDEYSTIDPLTWQEVIRPALADKQGEALIMGSPRGYNHLYDMYTLAQETAHWAAFKFSTAEGGLVAEEEIAAVKETLDPRTFAQEFEADFTQSVNRVFLMFQREHHVRADLQDTGSDLLIGIDFNVAPMSAVICQKAGDECHVLEELSLFNSNTQELAEVLKSKYAGRRMMIYPDPTGNARKTSAPVGQTDFTILQQAGLRVWAPPHPYPVVDRVNCTNALLCNAHGKRRLFIHPRCKRLIEGLERLPYKEGTSIPDKSLGLDHHTDALGYLIMAEFPLYVAAGRIKVTGV